MQDEAVQFAIFHPCQFGGVQQNSNVGIYLLHLVHAGWAKELKTSVVAFNLVQYFLSLNHDIITYLLARMGFPTPMVEFFKSYLVGQKTRW